MEDKKKRASSISMAMQDFYMKIDSGPVLLSTRFAALMPSFSRNFCKFLAN